MCCCNEERPWKEEHLTDGAILNERHCTDCPMIIIFLLFLIGWFIVLAIALVNGDPKRIILPNNFDNQLCGDVGGELEHFPNLFIPMPNRLTYGVCVNKCPETMSYVCNNRKEKELGGTDTIANTYYSHTKAEFEAGKNAVTACAGTCTAAETKSAKRYFGLLKKLGEFKCFLAFYSTSSTLHRCLPFDFDTDNKTLLQQVNESASTLSDLADTLGVGSFFVRGFAEVKQCWIVIAISCITACIISLLWVVLLRWILAPIVYLCIVLIFVLLVVLGILAMLQANHLEGVTLPGEKGTEDQVKFWRAMEYIAFLLAAVYVVIVIVVINRIRIAIILMEESSKAFVANPALVLLPVIILVILLAFLAMFVVTSLYIQTIGSLNDGIIRGTAVQVFGEDRVNQTLAAAVGGADFVGANVSGIEQEVNVSTFNTSQAVKILHAYNFFGFLWIANFFIMFGFFVMAMVVATWYFSATGVEIDQYDGDSEKGRIKGTNAGTFCGAFVVACRYHLGTILFGSLLIAIVQFIRAVVLYIEQAYLSKWKSNATVKALIYILNCVLECIERLVRIISKAAFVITCVKNSNFCSSAVQALGILLNNIVRVGTLTTLATVAVFLVKAFIVGCNLLLAFGLIRINGLTDGQDVESGLFPLFGIMVITFIISSLFLNVFEACVDTIMICFFIDEGDFEGKFLPPNLAKLVDKFKHIEDARRTYEHQMKNAQLGTVTDIPVKSSAPEEESK